MIFERFEAEECLRTDGQENTQVMSDDENKEEHAFMRGQRTIRMHHFAVEFLAAHEHIWFES